MILAAFLMVQAAAPAPPADDIVVIGQRLQRDFKARVDFGKAGARCRVTKSTGDAASDRKVMREALNAELTSCVDAQHRTGVAALVAQRRRA
jgi:hypothetical protein